tara:strand:- start:1046 stop:1726 length:681 start_codon:yes stop_codon:yes gene_type:complete
MADEDNNVEKQELQALLNRVETTTKRIENTLQQQKAQQEEHKKNSDEQNKQIEQALQQKLEMDQMEERAKRSDITKGAHEEWFGSKDKRGLHQMAEEKIQEGMRGYDNFVASMSQVVALCQQLNKAVAASDPIGGVISKLSPYLAKERLLAKTSNYVREFSDWMNHVDYDKQIKQLEEEEKNVLKTSKVALANQLHKLEKQAEKLEINLADLEPSSSPGYSTPKPQ